MENLGIIFKSVVKGSNIITPEVEKFVRRGKYVCELSYGSGIFLGSYIYGVTVVNTETMKHEIELSQSFSAPTLELARKDALEYIESLA